MPLEDDFGDIVKKARHGQGLAAEALAKASGLAVADVALLEQGRRAPTRAEAQAIGKALGLRGEALTQIAVEGWIPGAIPARLECLETIVGDIGGYAVKGYLLYDKESAEAVMIDTGYNPAAMIEVCDVKKVRLTAVWLTHGHTDHAGGLDRILKRWPVGVYLGVDDLDLLPWTPPRKQLVTVAPDEDGRIITAGRLTLRMMMTPGHTPGGICYRVERRPGPLCFVGDTLFAGSIGRANPPSLYRTHLESVRRRVLDLPPSTVLLPGHGPATTVAEELAHNPFA